MLPATHQMLTRAALMVAVLSALSGSAAGAEPAIILPFETDSAAVRISRIDSLVRAQLAKHRIEPAPLCSDEVFIRRIHLDVIGTMPDPLDVREFLADRRPDKRAAMIDTLLGRAEFADYWAMKWCDLLRVKAEFPINLWPNAVQAYHRWVRDAVGQNKPYDEFVRELLTSSGSNFRVPPVNFYRAIQSVEPSALAEAVALTFMGDRMTSWPQARRDEMATFFSRIAYKSTAEWKEEIVYLDPAPVGAVEAVLPDGTKVRIEPDQDPRHLFADWLIRSDNPWFARSVVNRVWSWFLGRGIIHEPDDIRLDNPPVNPELLAYLEQQLVREDYDLRHIFRLILNSRTYQQSSISRSDHSQAEALFAHYMVRRLDAEVLIDALCWFGGSGEQYTSLIPEPFTFIPEYQRTIALADGSISSQFLEMFGRPARDTGLESERNTEPTDAQRLHLLNSSHVQRKIRESRRLQVLVTSTRGNHRDLIQRIYLNVVSRFPMNDELSIAEAYFRTGGLGTKQAAEDLVWALVNSKEFLYRH